MSRAVWFVLSYDVADHKRLAKVHRLMKKNGLAVQKSVFFIQRTEAEMNNLLNQLDGIILSSRDDIRAYPVVGPDKVWTTGGILESFPLVRPGWKNEANIPAALLEKKRSKPSMWSKMKNIFKSK